MNLLVVAFIAAIVVVGYGFTLLLDLELRVEERILHGVIVGSVVVSAAGFAVGWWADMTRGSVVVASLLSLGLSGFGWRRRPERIAAEWRDLRRRFGLSWRDDDHPWVLLLIVCVSIIVSVRVLDVAYGTTADGGVSAGHLSTFGDWSAHLAYAASFVYADNFPPELPTAAGESFAYHFGTDFFSAMFVPLGVSLQGSLQLSSALLAIAFPGVMYVSVQRFLSGRLAAAMATLVFLAAGGTAALYRFVFEDLIDGGLGVLGNLPRAYAFDGFDRNWLDNPVTGFLYPQRPTQIGFPLVLLGLALLWRSREGGDGRGTDTVDERRTMAFVGVACGILPIFHVFSFGVLLVMGLWWAFLERRNIWAWFAGPALAIGVPIVLWQLPANGGEGREVHLGWVLGKVPGWDRTIGDFAWFWLLNTGVFIPLVILGMRLHRDLTLRFLPIFGLLLIPNVGIWHFWVGNNAKYVVFFLLLGAIFVGAWLADWFRRGAAGGLVALVALVTLTLSGGLDIWRAFEGTAEVWPAAYMSGDDVLVGEWARDQTPPGSVFASANNNVHPVRAIAGRTVVSGSAGRLNDLGVDWVQRQEDLRIIYGVNEGFDAVIRKYEIDYVVLGPAERQSFRPSDAPPDWDPAIFWDAAAPIVYDIGGYKVYDVRGFQTP